MLGRRVYIAILVFLVAVSLSLTGCIPRAKPTITVKPQVIVTLFPQYDFVRQIAGDKVDVSLLLPTGVESHSYEPSPRDIVDVQKAAMFIYTGKYMEPWAEKIIAAAKDKPLLIVDASHGITLMDEDDHDHHHDDDEHHYDDDDHHHDGMDPHIWLDPVNAQQMVDNILAGLVQIDPVNADFYRQNGEAYKQQLQALDQKFADSFSGLENRTILYAGHFAFGYFAARYNLENVSPYSGFAPNAEPTPQRITELIKNVQKSNTKVIYFEELIDPKVARVIAEQTGAEMILLHGAHNISKDELSRGVTYISIMEDNLPKLLKGLSGQ